MKKRIAKKLWRCHSDYEFFVKWISELRYYLQEASGEMEFIIIDSFKNRIKGKQNVYFKLTRMHEYVREAKGDYGN